MTREEEIQQASKEMGLWEVGSEMFRLGAEWADKHPKEGLWDKEKVLEWAYENIVFDDSELIIEDLINAMEE